MPESQKISRRNYVKYASAIVLAIAAVVAGQYLYSELPKLRPIATQTKTQIIKSITPKEAYALIQKNRGNQDFLILDVRTLLEFSNEYIEGAINLDFQSETFKDELSKLDRNRTYLVYCASGRRSGNSLKIMQEIGFTEVYEISGGIVAWKQEGLPTVTSPMICDRFFS